MVFKGNVIVCGGRSEEVSKSIAKAWKKMRNHVSQGRLTGVGFDFGDNNSFKYLLGGNTKGKKSVVLPDENWRAYEGETLEDCLRQARRNGRVKYFLEKHYGKEIKVFIHR